MSFIHRLELNEEETKRLEFWMKCKKFSTVSEAVIGLLDDVERTCDCADCGKKFTSFEDFPKSCPLCGKEPYSLIAIESDE